ncbi:MAG TPA: AbrB family transcriptional regulator [Cyanobacteria bacterium UBA8156]|nr:AbrB family transcriptional regulator [Cyanobacteria bacterium UBA8156]
MGRPISRRHSEQGLEVLKPLTGRALLQKLKECGHLPIREQARRCGYLSRAKSPSGSHEKANLVDFYQAQVEARGHILDPKTQRDRRGREPANRVTVHKNGQIVIGVAYTQMMGLEPGDEFEIKLGYKHIRLNQLDGGEALG